MNDVLITEEDRERQQAKANVEAIAQYRIHLDKIKNVFGTDEGLYVLDWILTTLCGIKGQIFVSNSAIYNKAAKQDLGNELLAEVTASDVNIHHKLIDKWVKDANKGGK